jgi:PIN like domain
VMKPTDSTGRPADSTGPGKPSPPDSNAGGIFDGGFDTYKTLTSADYSALFKSGLITLDANTLLDLYRYHAETRQALLDTLARLEGRLWVPHQAMLEFFENRISVIESRAEEAEQVIEDLQKKEIDLESVVRQWANRTGFPKEKSGAMIDTIRVTVNTVAAQIGDHVSDDSISQAEDTAKDPVLASLNSILQKSVGAPLPDAELLSAMKEAKQRIIDKRPPGWRDANKRRNPEGDYLIWYETLREARCRQADVLLVTGDVKDDWWRKEHGEARGPLPELAYEMRETAGVRLFMLRPESLLIHARDILKIRVSNDAVEDAQRVTAGPVQRYPRIEEGTGRRYVRSDLTGPGIRPSLSYEWHGARPPQGRHWMYSEDKMDQMYADGGIDFTSTGRPVRKRYLDEQSEQRELPERG